MLVTIIFHNHVSLVNKQGKAHCWHKVKSLMDTSTSPLILASMTPYHQYPLLLSVCVSVTPMVNHSVLISYIFTSTSVYRGETITLLRGGQTGANEPIVAPTRISCGSWLSSDKYNGGLPQGHAKECKG